LHRASDPQFAVVLQLERASAGGPGTQRFYNAETAEVAAKRLEDFAAGPWGKRLPAIAQSWRRVTWTAAAAQFAIQFGERFWGAEL
jgi:transposase-like protein